MIEEYEELWKKAKRLIRWITKNPEDYEKKNAKIKFNLGDDLPLNKTIEIHNEKIVVRAVFHENNKHYQQDILDECLCEL